MNKSTTEPTNIMLMPTYLLQMPTLDYSSNYVMTNSILHPGHIPGLLNQYVMSMNASASSNQESTEKATKESQPVINPPNRPTVSQTVINHPIISESIVNIPDRQQDVSQPVTQLVVNQPFVFGSKVNVHLNNTSYMGKFIVSHSSNAMIKFLI